MYRRYSTRPTTTPEAAPVESPARDAIAPITVRIPAAIQMTGIGRSKLYELIAEGAIDVVKIGTATLITVESLHRLMAQNRR